MGAWSLLYDAECPFCCWSAGILVRWGRSRRLKPVALQDAEAHLLLPGMDHETRMRTWHLVAPGGRVESGGRALAPLFRLLPGGAPLVWLASLSPALSDRVYAWISRNRGHIARLLRLRGCAVRDRAV